MDARRLDRRDLVATAATVRRIALFHEMTETLGDTLSMEELDIHFTHMPVRYWTRVTGAAVRQHLELIHEFIKNLNGPATDGTVPIVRWKHVPDRGITEVEVCTWDRLGLLANVAGAFAAVGLNIVRADIFTRADNVVLDLFEVSEPAGSHVRDEAKLEATIALLTAALKPGGTVPAIAALPGAAHPTVAFDSDRGDHYVAMMVEADDRVGLLYDIFRVLANCAVNVAHAIITTDAGRAGDVFYLTDSDGCALRDPAHLERIRTLLVETIM